MPVRSEDDFYGGIEVGRKFAKATKLPIRYIDIIFVLYGQEDSARFKTICSTEKPKCDICGVKKYCNYSVQQRTVITPYNNGQSSIGGHHKEFDFSSAVC